MQIMMGQNRQTPDILTEHEEQYRCAAGYVDEPKNKSYLPSSVHGSPCHMTTLARNALILVFRIWLSTCIHYTHLQSKVARNMFTIINWTNYF